MDDRACDAFLQQVLPRLGLRWRGFRRVRGQVCKRIARRLRALGLPDLQAYRDRLEASPEEWAVLDAACRVTISRFLRDRAVYERLREAHLPHLCEAAAREGRPLRCWSAGCASGEEPYTLALVLRLGLGRSDFEILATDADPVVLARAQAGEYAPATLRELPGPWREAAFEGRGARLRLRDEFRAGVEFARRDLREEPPAGPFDLVLCRNLAFTYFDEERQRALLERLALRMRRAAPLVLGAHEALPAGAAWRRDGRAPIYLKA